MENEKIEELLRKWYDSKQELAKLEKKCEKYRKMVNEIMVNQSKNRLSEGGYVATKRTQTRSHVSQKNMPTDVWNKYATTSQYDVIIIDKK